MEGFKIHDIISYGEKRVQRFPLPKSGMLGAVREGAVKYNDVKKKRRKRV